MPPPPPGVVQKALGVSAITIEWLAGDGSDRCYYRLRTPNMTHSSVLMQLSEVDAKALKEDGYDWVKLCALLNDRGVLVPRVIATIPDHAALIIEDYGDKMLEGIVTEAIDQSNMSTVLGCYEKSFEILSRFLSIEPSPQAPWCQRRFDAERYLWELNFFKSKFIDSVIGLDLNAGDLKSFERDASTLSSYLDQFSSHFVHRDFHSRNLMIKEDNIAVIDFQDARLGPAVYDLVSLCFDSYVPLTSDTRVDLLKTGIEFLASANPGIRNELESSWRPVLLQRQLKAIGSFGYLTVDKGRGNYLRYVNPALETISGLQDDRWPFLSGDLLERMKQKSAHLE